MAWFTTDEAKPPDGAPAALAEDFRRVLASFEQAELLGGKALTLATVEFLRDVAANPDPRRLSTSGFQSLALELTDATLTLKSGPGSDRISTATPHPIDHHIVHPKEILRLPLREGLTWSCATFAYGQETMTATMAVEGTGESVSVPAGSFSRCALLRSDFELDGAPGNTYHRANLHRSGTRRQWFAPGVGLVKLVYEHGDGVVSSVELQRRERGEDCHDPWPLLPGYSWWYRTVDSRSDAAILDRLWVVGREDNVSHLAGYTMTETPPVHE